ncbi:hypothetical protein GJ496_009684 [Pomphorhynchus laevis]|nr:hypothetical protein GJ496_009684 [Pomphorhynchus laevis]
MVSSSKLEYSLSSSVPWILTDFLLDSDNYANSELFFSPVCIYDDAARVALNDYKDATLFKKIEVEIDQFLICFVEKLTLNIFTYYKQLAGCLLLDKRYRLDCELTGINLNFPTYKRFEHLLCKQQISILGKSVKFGQMLRNCLREMLINSMQSCLDVFESKGLPFIMELKAIIDQHRLMFQLICNDAKTELFGGIDVMLTKILHVGSQKSNTRITDHIIDQIHQHLIPHYKFDMIEYSFHITNVECCCCSSNKLDYNYGATQLSTAFKIAYQESQIHLSCSHLQCMFSIIGYKGISAVVTDLRTFIYNTISNSLNPALDKIKSILPPSIELEYIGDDMDPNDLLSHFVVVLRQLIRSKDLSEIFGILAKLGNALAICKLLESSMSQEEISDLIYAARFRTEDTAKAQVIGPVHLYQELRKSISRPRIDMQIVRESDLMNSERLCLGLSFYAKILTSLHVQRRGGFADVWAALVFVAACKQKSDQHSDIWHLSSLHGIIWAGQAILYSLGEKDRYNRFDICQRVCIRSRVHPSKRSQALNEFVERATLIRSYLLQTTANLEKIRLEHGSKKNLFSQCAPKRYIPPPTHPYVTTYGE